MKSTNFNRLLTTLLPGLAIFSISLTIFTKPSQAGFLEDIQRTVEKLNKTVEDVHAVYQSTAISIGKIGDLARALGLSPKTPSTDIFDVYSNWYNSLSLSEKEVVNSLILEYAEDKQLSFPTFSKSTQFTALSPQAKSKARIIFFKLRQVFDVALPAKNQFLSYALCLGSETKTCVK
jgi:hypothetical protein